MFLDEISFDISFFYTYATNQMSSAAILNTKL